MKLTEALTENRVVKVLRSETPPRVESVGGRVVKLAVCAAGASTDDLQHHHLVPRGEGGSDDERNLITLCCDCHLKLHERRRNGVYNASERTRVGLAAAKARGVKLGRQEVADVNREAAAARDASLRPILEELAHLSSRAAATEIERRGFGKFSYKTVTRARARLGLEAAS